MMPTQKKNKTIMMNRETNSNAIPMDLIYQILSRLPAKSICKFCCVSKLWKSIICSQYFNELFRTISSSNPHLLIAIEDDDISIGWRLFSSHHPQSHYGKSSIEVSADFHIKIKGIPETRGSTFSDCSYASGLIFFSDRVNVICNPSTRQYVMLPRDEIADKPTYGLLGFDPIGKQFKVLVYKGQLDDGLMYRILTLGNENERWREMKCPLPYEFFCEHICINGFLYYIVLHKSEGHNSEVICFDVRFEKFKLLHQGCYDKYLKLINYKGKLGVAKLIDPHRGFPLELRIWVLEDVDEVEWMKYEYTLRAPENVVFDRKYPFFIAGMTASGDIVLRRTDRARPFFVLYFDLERNTSLVVNIEGISEGNYTAHYFVDHVENLWFDVMKTKYAETCVHHKPDRTEASTSSSNDYKVRTSTSSNTDHRVRTLTSSKRDC